MELEKNEQMNILYNFYGKLLTEKQKNYMNLYYVEDFSLGEIAEQSKVSRQAVYDNLKRSEEILKSYEEKLNIVGELMLENTLTSQLEEYVLNNYSNDKKLVELVTKINGLSNK